MKKILIGLLLIVSTITSWAYDFSAVAPSGQTLYYNIVGSNAQVTHQRTSSPVYTNLSGALEIPSIVNYNGNAYLVTSIGSSAFSYCSGLTSVTIPNSVTSIGGSAFYGCSGLTSVTIGENVQSIADGAFYNCSNVRELYYNAKNCAGWSSSDNRYGFNSMRKVRTLVIGDSVRTIPSYAFYDKDSLTSVTIPNSVTSIGSSAFSYCIGLTSVTIGNSVTSIGDGAFSGCSGLTSVTIPNSVTSIGGSAFSGCSGLTSVTIGENVQSIADYAFSSCSNVQELYYYAKNCAGWSSFDSRYGFNSMRKVRMLVIGDSVRSIPSYAFNDKDSLTSVTIGNSVQSIGSSAFQYCSSLTSVTIGNSVQSIGSSAFSGCNGLTSVTIPNSVTSIGGSAFSGCSSLTSVTIGNSVTSIASSAFSGCSGLTSVTIPNSVTSIGGSAFSGCSSLTSVTIGENVQSIADYAFSSCSNVQELYYYAKNCAGWSSFDSRYGFNSMRKVRMLVIGDSVRSIPSYAFNDKDSLTSVTIGNSVQSIGSSAFQYCSSLTSVTIGNSVQSIGSSAFSGCNISLLKFFSAEPPSITTNSFTGNSFGNESILVPCASEGLYAYSFRNYGTGVISTWDSCDGVPLFFSINSDSMLSVSYRYVPGAYRIEGFSWPRLIIPDSVEIDGEYKKVKKIASDAFRDCRGLLHIDIPSTVTTIESGAFYNCSSLSGLVSISDNVVDLAPDAFRNCNSIDSLYIGCNSSMNPFVGLENVKYLYYNVRSSNDNYIYSEDDGHIRIFSGVNMLNSNSFPMLKKLVIGDSVEVLCPAQFSFIQTLDTLILGRNIRDLGKFTFFGCTRLNFIDYNIDSCSGFSIYSPFTCSGSPVVVFGDNVRIIPANLLRSDRGFWTYNGYWCNFRHNGSNSYHAEYDRIFSETSIGNTLLRLPAGLYSIGRFAFRNCTNISGTIVFPDSLKIIGSGAFQDCDSILYLNTNTSSAEIGDSSFFGCDRLVRVTIGDSTPSVGNSAFEGCFRLSQVSVGNSVTSIGNSAFKDCVRLVNPLLPQSLTSIGSYAFDGCISIGGEITFPSQMQSIGDYAYRGIGTITAFNMKGMNSPSIASHTFESVSDSIPVYIPCGSYMNYYTRNFWENFANLQEVAPYMISVSSADSLMGTARVVVSPTCSNAQARIQAIPLNNFHFTRWSDGATENPRYVSVTCDTHIVASFAPDIAQLTVHSNDSTKGMVTGSGRYTYNSQVTMSATSIGANHFLKWTDGNRQNPRPVVVGCDTNYTAIFVSDISSITAISANPQMGTAGGSGIYYYQNQISLTASPNYGYHFTQWNDGNTSNPRNVVVEQDSSFTAFFALNIYSVSANSNNNSMGSVTGTGSYTYNTEMSMMATPAFGYHFEQWNDGNTNNPRTITVTRDSAFTAQFAANAYQITAVANDPNMGSAFGAGTYNYNTQITLTATAEYGYHFTQWSDGSTDNPRLVTVTNSANYTAMFEINSYTLMVNSSNPAIGTVSGGGSYNYLTPVNISANPNIGYHFTQWSDGNTDNPRLVSVIQNVTYTAQFSINTYAISATSNNTVRGMVSGSGTYAHFSQDTLRATPFYGYHFTQWNDGNTDNPRIVVVTDVANYTAQFDPNNYLVMGNSTDMTIGVVVGSGTYAYQSQTALTAQPMLHYHFVQWTDSITDNPRTITVTRDTVLTAEFAIDQHSLTLISDNPAMGSTSNSTSIAYGGATYISATANYGYHFTQWSDGNTSNPRRIVVTQDTIFTAQFATNTYMATITVNDTLMGSVSGSGGYDYLTNVTLTASENYGYHFVQWNDGITNNPRQIRITQDTALVAQFSINQYQLTVHSSDSLMGGVSGTGNYDYLSQVAISATPLLHYHFVQWNDGNTSNPRMVTITSDVEYTALFEEDDKYMVSVVANDSTYGTVSGGGEYYIGAQITIRATAGNHYYFSEWSDGSSENPRVVTVIGNMTYTANFEPTPYLVTVTANDLSRGNVSGGGTYPYGSEVEISATAYPGFVFVKWHDGDSNATRNITVLDNCYYQAIFEADNTEGISDIVYDYSVRTANMQIMVDGVMGRKVEVYDISGRRIAYIDKSGDKMIANVPARGVYLIKVGDTPARKVVVM